MRFDRFDWGLTGCGPGLVWHWFGTGLALFWLWSGPAPLHPWVPTPSACCFRLGCWRTVRHGGAEQKGRGAQQNTEIRVHSSSAAVNNP